MTDTNTHDANYVDLSRMMVRPRCAVICRTKSELDIFYDNSDKQLSDKLYWNQEWVRELWNEYKSRTAFTLFSEDDSGPYSMTYCNEEWFKEHGYELIEFSELCNVRDIDESDCPIDTLFGGVV